MQTHTTTDVPRSETTYTKLQECLRGELAAAETYEIALKQVQHVGLHRSLQEILVSHASRAARLRKMLLDLGVEVPQTSGAWGKAVAVLQRGADLMGNRAAIAALEEGEDHQLKLYRDAAGAIEAPIRQTIQDDMLAEQMRTHGLCRDLKHYTQTPS